MFLKSYISFIRQRLDKNISLKFALNISKVNLSVYLCLQIICSVSTTKLEVYFTLFTFRQSVIDRLFDFLWFTG